MSTKKDVKLEEKETIENNLEELSVTERRAINNKEYIKYQNEKVDIVIPLGGEKIGTTVTASCDGVIYEIKLGETVKVPRKVADVIKRSIDANVEVQKKIEKVSKGAVQIGEY